MLNAIANRPASAVLEIGCGTARNLRYLAGRSPQHALYGMDASTEMLDTARRSLRRDGQVGRIMLAHGLAGDVTLKMMHRDEPFDVVFCSYVLSMIPDYQPAIEAAFALLRPGGTMYVVDFWDQTGLPRPFARLLQGWLALFDVHFRPGVINTLRRLDATGQADTRIRSVARRYAYLAEITKVAR
jgi:S-adenosylmethionine-diacylgycerolhomoserine-N-methlytransferase